MRKLTRVILPVATAKAVKEAKRFAVAFKARYAEVRKERGK